MRSQDSLSPHLGGRVRETGSFNIHTVSPLVLMVLYNYVCDYAIFDNKRVNKFRYFSTVYYMCFSVKYLMCTYMYI